MLDLSWGLLVFELENLIQLKLQLTSANTDIDTVLKIVVV